MLHAVCCFVQLTATVTSGLTV